MRAPELLPHLRTRDLGREALFFDTTDSTQTRALELVRTGAPHGLLVHAETQSEGRGRRGRVWLSGEGSLTFSVVIARGVVAENAAHYSFIAGLGVRRALPGTDSSFLAQSRLAVRGSRFARRCAHDTRSGAVLPQS